MSEPREVTLLGSTGSIGRQAVAVAGQNPDRLRVTALAAGGGDVARLADQALTLGVRTVAVARATAAQDLQLAFYAAASRRGWARGEYALPEILAGPRAAEELAARRTDVVLNGITGSIGLGPTLSALRAGNTVALANKESLVAGGDLVLAAAGPGQLVPVDSEHSALAQCLRGGARGEVARLVLTASGGPFRGRAAAELADVTPAQALAHPTWDMGPVVTINSATLVNKGLELIEAHLLFGVPYADIDVVVHPQSIVHSMVTFTDGATIAQASPPDMRLPIALALAWPDRLPHVQPALDWSTASTWEFAPLDADAFPAVRLARAAGEAGGVVPALYNAANEEAVAAFLAGRLRFPDVVGLVARTLDDAPDLGAPTCVDDVLAAERWARQHARAALAGGPS
ncbi:1-deoxy-D-xylulose 5-phosphate reductoisomerase [Geodermatophilus dictyosporus]|uniref:1-deoxy-D-xylulose 5-phosphate reductoisomerase n=1 Tax=Geodermatophilus dictyosporus TaxID=1523247 RepID=A0A1I5KLJ1_9ACTN|nr:1-deoxy-D-xylulose-5-phosphate reductoisomerase [Geodermatophilus dictyosporus]SFO85918.1 1-deoxy-D-xylulose 5-phosphate reductoisomerase [Geodermatophilus dictyosporus]